MDIESDFLRGLLISMGFGERALESLTCSTTCVTAILLLATTAPWIGSGDGKMAAGISSTSATHAGRTKKANNAAQNSKRRQRKSL